MYSSNAHALGLLMHALDIYCSRTTVLIPILIKSVTGTLSSSRVCCKDDKFTSFKHIYMPLRKFVQAVHACPGMQAASSTYEQYLSLASQHLGHSTHQELLCDRCLQPIDEATFQANVWRLEASPSASQ